MAAHGNTPPFGKLHLEIVVFESFRPVVLAGSTLNLEDFEYLVYFTVTNEEGSALGHLCKNAPDRPYVDGSRVFFCT